MRFTEGFENVNDWIHTVTVYPVDGGAPYRREVGEIFVPHGWDFAFWHGLPVAHDPQNDTGWAQPEAHRMNGRDFPYRVHSGEHAYMWFSFYRISHAALLRSFESTPGQALSASAWVHAWSSNSDEPRNSDDGRNLKNVRFRIGINPVGDTAINSSSTVWSDPAQIYDAYQQIRIDNVTARAGWCTLFVRGLCLYPLKHNDFYVDHIEFWTDDAPQWYPPRVDYEKEYLLASGDITPAQHATVAAEAYQRHVTLGFSADDAGSGPPQRKVTALWATKNSWSSKTDVVKFFDTYYPGVALTQRDLYDDGGTPPDPGEPPPPLARGSLNPIGLHVTDWIPGVIAGTPGEPSYVRDARPWLMKQTIGGGNCYDIKQMYPDCQCVWRNIQPDGDKSLTDHGYVDAPDRRAAARLLLETYLRKGLQQWASSTDYIESVNEVTAGRDPADKHARIVEFSIYFLEELHKELGDAVRGVVLNVPVGNPEPEELERFLPAVQAASQYGALLGYHNYWSANANAPETWLRSHYEWLFGRWLEYDAYWTARGLYPVYSFGESGVIVSDGPFNLAGNQGWRKMGWDRYLADINKAADLITAWNAQHQNRCLGLTLFNVGSAWADFSLPTDRLLALTGWAQAKYT